MLMRSSIFAIAVWLGGLAAPVAWGAIDVYVSLVDGSVSLHNPESEPYAIIFYSLVSDGDWLLPGGWTPIAVYYDADGDHSVDADDDWTLFTDPGTTGELSEGELFGNGGILAPDQTVSLGLIWNTSGEQDLEAIIADTTGIPTDVIFDYRSFDADFDLDLNVDSIDLNIWESNYGLFGATHSQGDADRSGLVDGDDFLIWQLQVGSTPAGSGAVLVQSFSDGGSVPEPGAALLAAIALAAAILQRVGRASRRSTL